MVPVYPACAGIDPLALSHTQQVRSLSRMRGDRPSAPSCRLNAKKFTPHARGSTSSRPKTMRPAAVYPACAGIDLAATPFPKSWIGLPRMRGDRPAEEVAEQEGMEFTPHARGSTYFGVYFSRRFFVYPACAGIDLT